MFNSMKKKKDMSAHEKEAKMGVLKDISSMASDAMGDKLKGLKKVSVASDSKEGLKSGLDKAKELLDKNIAHTDESPEDAEKEGDEESPEHEAMESPDEEMSEDKEPEDMDSDELDKHIQYLQMLKDKKNQSKY